MSAGPARLRQVEPAYLRPATMLRHLRGLVADLSVVRIVRQAVVIGAILAAWITLKPFQSLSSLESGDLLTGQEGLTYGLFGLLAAAAFALAYSEHRAALAALLSPATMALGAWLCISGVIGQDPATSAKRLALTAAVVVVTACIPLLARSRAEFRDLLATAALTLLVVCYLGLLLAPDLAIHQRTDFLEPELAGNWRGTFGHKNAAAGLMAMILFIGIGVFRTGGRVAGAAIVAIAGAFLVGSEGKSALGLCLVALAMSGLFTLVRSFAGRALVALGPVLAFNLFTVGTVVSDGIAALVAKLPIDATFTGRTDVWTFAVESIAAKPLFGHGYAAFWNTQAVRDAAAEGSTWAGTAAHSHNGYLDSILTLGFVGFALTLAVLVILPLRDFQRVRPDGPAAPFAMMFLQIWMFGILLASMESFFYDRADPIWFTFLIAVFGLRYFARFGTR